MSATVTQLPVSNEDEELLDAYSRAVTGAVERVGPAVASLAVGRRRHGQGAGSGVLIAPDGYVLTNAHVVDGASSVEVTLTDGASLDARTVGVDRATDLAIVRIAGSSLPFLPPTNAATLRPGQLVVAIGNPLGFQSTVSAGVVSATARALRGRDGRLIENLVQHTAPLNPGNSGGPLVEARGRLVGINTAIIAHAQGMSFAIPIETVHWVVPKLLADGRVRRGYLGVQGQNRPIDRRLVRAYHLDHELGVEVMSVESGGPAHAAGLLSGDLLLAIDGVSLPSVDALLRALAQWSPGKPVKLDLLRRAKRIEIEARPKEV